MLADRFQFPPTLRAALQLRFFGLADLRHLRHLSTSKLALPSPASRTPRLLHPLSSRKRRSLSLPDPLQSLILLLQLLNLLFQPLDFFQRLRELFLQILPLLIFPFRRLLMPLTSFTHVFQCTAFRPARTRAVSTVFSRPSALVIFGLSDAKQEHPVKEDYHEKSDCA
jgi:hypothetical protein